MSLDQIKDSQRFIGLIGVLTVRYAAYVQLAANQTWYTPTVDCDGLSICGFFVKHYSTSPAALAAVGIEFSPNADFSEPPAPAFLSTTPPSPGNIASISTPTLTFARYSRFKVTAGSTAGTYTFAAYVTYSV